MMTSLADVTPADGSNAIDAVLPLAGNQQPTCSWVLVALALRREATQPHRR